MRPSQAALGPTRQSLLLLPLQGEEKQEWNRIKEEFVLVRRMGGSGDDPVARMTGAMAMISEHVKSIPEALHNNESIEIGKHLERLQQEISSFCSVFLAEGSINQKVDSVRHELQLIAQVLNEEPKLLKPLAEVGEAMQQLQKHFGKFIN